jgi:hypothetical protein
MGIEYDVSIGSSNILDFDRLNKERELGKISKSNLSLNSDDYFNYKKGSSSSLFIDLNSNKSSSIIIDHFFYPFEMLESFLAEYGLRVNYIYLMDSKGKKYFENFNTLKEHLKFSNQLVNGAPFFRKMSISYIR